ncbi:hypothetical protein [uncultured Dubosiella sp.]|uniref:hypothetical protein n=1 Tax=uncultured Dubosiella sp. TaxID=1937011 RepID=UPI00272E0B17|nr:hypothetical protein [uncultured Dubosiella sp.]
MRQSKKRVNKTSLTHSFLQSVGTYSTYISIFIAAFSLVFGIITYMMTIQIEEHSNYLSDLQAPCVYTMTITGQDRFPAADSSKTIITLPKTRIAFDISSGSILDIGNVVMVDEETVGKIDSWSVSEHQTDRKAKTENKKRTAKTDSLTYRPETWNYDPETKTAYTVLFVKTGNNTSDIWLLIMDKNKNLKIYGYDALPTDQKPAYPTAFQAYRSARKFLVENNI